MPPLKRGAAAPKRKIKKGAFKIRKRKIKSRQELKRRENRKTKTKNT